MNKFPSRTRRARLCSSKRRRLFFEPLESRLLLDAGGAHLVDDLFEVRQNDDPQTFEVLENDAFPDDYSGERRITSVSYGSEGGWVEIADDGRSISYTPPAGFSGTETFVYYVDNQLSARVRADVHSPLVDDEYRLPHDGQAKVLDVLENDPFWADYEGPGEITLVSGSRLGGDVEIAADGKSLLYTSPRDAVHGNDTIVYIVDDVYQAEARITLRHPLKFDKGLQIVQDSEGQLLDLLANDHFWPGYSGQKTITHVSQPVNGGTVTIVDDGKAVFYTPAPGFSGGDEFIYVVDGVYEARVSIYVLSLVRDSRFPVSMNGVDALLPVLRFARNEVIDRITWVGETAHGGTVEITADGQEILYSAPAGFEGTDTFEYLVDGKHRATVEVNVMSVGQKDSKQIHQDSVDNVLHVLSNDFKSRMGYPGPRIITSVSETTEGGSVSITEDGRSLVYTPQRGFHGNEWLTYTLDGQFEIEVHFGVHSHFSIGQMLHPDPAKTEYELHVLGDQRDHSLSPDRRITSVGETANGGLVTISEDGRFLRFSPAEGGSDQFTYTVDGEYETSFSVSFCEHLRSDSFLIDQNSQASTFDVLRNDDASDRIGRESSHDYDGPREITSVGPTEHGGTVTIAADGKTLRYEPAPDFFGVDSFTYTADGLMQETVTVQVIRRARDDTFHAETDSLENALPVLVNDLFGAEYTGAGRLTAVTETSQGGTVSVSPDGRSISYTPPVGFTGQDKFTYTVDGVLKAEVTVWVGPLAQYLFPRFDSLPELEQFLFDDALARYDHLFGQKYEDPFVRERRSDYFVRLASGDTLGHSETNVQTAGVDEGDIIETDDDYLYILSGGELIIAAARPAEDLSIASRVPLEGAPIAEYLDGDRLTVISRTNDWSRNSSGEVSYLLSVNALFPDTSEICVTVYDVSDRESPVIVERMKMEGEYVESRRIDGSVFLTLRNDHIKFQLHRPERIRAADGSGNDFFQTREQYIEHVTEYIDGFIEEGLLRLPDYARFDADGVLLEQGPLHAMADLIHPRGRDADSLLSVVSLNMRDDEPGITAATGVFTTGESQIYGSLESLYVFSEQYTREDDAVTQILKFDWEAETGVVELAAQGQVVGQMLDQFSADEHEGDLRIVTTVENWRAGDWSDRSENMLFVLRDDGGVLEVVGGIQNLAPEEKIRSVRFLGDQALVTTFSDIGPLLALDLSDPTQPRSRGHAILPGYNSYMQMIDETHLLTVGRNSQWRGADGPMQVSLFDIEDLAHPRLIDQHVLTRSSTSEAEDDHHAFGWFAQHNVLAMPSVRVYTERVDEDGDGYRETSKTVREDELLLFSIDVTATRQSGDGIQLRGAVAHDSPVRRSAFIGEVLYSVAETSIQAVSIVDPTVLFAQITFESPPVLIPEPVFGSSWEVLYRILPVHAMDETPDSPTDEQAPPADGIPLAPAINRDTAGLIAVEFALRDTAYSGFNLDLFQRSPPLEVADYRYQSPAGATKTVVVEAHDAVFAEQLDTDVDVHIDIPTTSLDEIARPDDLESLLDDDLATELVVAIRFSA